MLVFSTQLCELLPLQTLDLCSMYLVKSMKGRLVQDFHLVVTDNQVSEILGAGQGTWKKNRIKVEREMKWKKGTKNIE